MKNSMKNSLNFKALYLVTGICLTFFASQLLAQNKIKHLIELESYFSHHLLVAEKLTHQLHLLEVNEGESNYKILKTYKMATGKFAGNKATQGDHRTPEGIYFINDFIPRTELLKRYGKEGEIYGIGAFALDYPNPFDKLKNKSGSGIWIHSTNDETRIEKGLDSRGCLVIANNDLKDLSQYIELNKTQLVVVDALEWQSPETFEKSSEKLKMTISSWREAWVKENFEEYISFYSPELFHDQSRGSYNSYKNYKRAVFSAPGSPEIDLLNLNIISFPDYAVAIFKQKYKSNTIDDTGVKVLYLVKDEYYNWKIFRETWSKAGGDRSLAFKPSQRFFENELGDHSAESKH
jgi:murein L,D-transpeptidase YafK